MDKELKPEYLGAFDSKGAGIILWTKRYQPEMLKKIVA
jgi:hypothetical protein